MPGSRIPPSNVVCLPHRNGPLLPPDKMHTKHFMCRFITSPKLPYAETTAIYFKLTYYSDCNHLYKLCLNKANMLQMLHMLAKDGCVAKRFCIRAGAWYSTHTVEISFGSKTNVTNNRNNRKEKSVPSTYNPTCWSPSPSQQWPLFHTWFTAVQPVCCTWLMIVQCIINFHFLALGANPWANVHRTWWRPAAITFPSSRKISAWLCKRSSRCALPNFFTFWPWETNPLAKVHQKGRWPATHRGLPSCQISLPCINLRRRYHLQKILRTKLQTVNDISPSMHISMCGQ